MTHEGYGDEIPALDLRRQRLRSGILFTAAIVLSGAVVVFLFGLEPPVQGTERYAAVGDFPSGHAWFNTRSPISLYGDLSGHVVVLLFSDFSRLSDVRDLSRFEALADDYEDQPVELIVVYVTTDSTASAWRSTVAAWGIGLPVIVDDDGLVSRSMMADRYPLVQVLDSHGRVAGRYHESWTTTDLAGVVDDVIMLGQAGRSLASDPYDVMPGEFIPSGMEERDR